MSDFPPKSDMLFLIQIQIKFIFYYILGKKEEVKSRAKHNKKKSKIIVRGLSYKHRPKYKFGSVFL